MIKSVEMDSTMLRRGAYSTDAHVMVLQFRDKNDVRAAGPVYRYLGVPLVVWKGLTRAGSHGKFFLENIKDRFQGVPQDESELLAMLAAVGSPSSGGRLQMIDWTQFIPVIEFSPA